MVELTKDLWEGSLVANEDLILKCMLQIAMAENMIKFCKKKITEFDK